MKHVFFYKFSAPWQETFADAKDGDGGGTIWHHFGTILRPFGSILGPPMQPKINFLEMAHTNLVSSMR